MGGGRFSPNAATCKTNGYRQQRVDKCPDDPSLVVSVETVGAIGKQREPIVNCVWIGHQTAVYYLGRTVLEPPLQHG